MLLNEYRSEFERLFQTTPVRFHQHVSDINPPSIHSLLQTLAIYSSDPVTILDETKSNPNFACTFGSYGASYGQGARTSSLPKIQETACGASYIKIDTQGSLDSIILSLRHARKEGCFAFITEIVRWQDGRAMPSGEWSNIREACRITEMFLIVDETLTLLRCGAPFAFQSSEYTGAPDLVFFGKGLLTAGVAIDWTGTWLNRLDLDVHNREEVYTDLQNITDVLDTAVAIRSLGILRLAIAEDWAARSLRIGKQLKDFVHIVNAEDRQEALTVGGIGCLLYFRSEDVAHHGVLGAGAGPGRVRWIPTLDPEMEDPSQLGEKYFGPRSTTHRLMLGQKLEELGRIPQWCSFCGDYSDPNQAKFCTKCCVAICNGCARYKHNCPRSEENEISVNTTIQRLRNKRQNSWWR